MKISARLAFFAIVVTLAYLGLAVWGMGGFAAFFSHAPLVVVVLATLVMAIASLFTEVNLNRGIAWSPTGSIASCATPATSGC